MQHLRRAAHVSALVELIEETVLENCWVHHEQIIEQGFSLRASWSAGAGAGAVLEATAFARDLSRRTRDRPSFRR